MRNRPSVITVLAMLPTLTAPVSAQFSAGEVADLVDRLALDLPHFETSFEIVTFGARPVEDPTPWRDVEPMWTEVVDMLVSGGMLRATVHDTRYSDPRVITWDSGTFSARFIDQGRVNLRLGSMLKAPSDLGHRESLLFHRIGQRFPGRGGLAESIRGHETLSQDLHDGVLTHHWIAGSSERFCQIDSVTVRLEPNLELVSQSTLMGSTHDPARIRDHLTMEVTIKYSEWTDYDGTRLPLALVRDSLFARDSDDDGEAEVLKGRVLFRRTAFRDRSNDPPPLDRFRIPLAPGARVFDDRGPVAFSVGGYGLDIRRIRFDLDDAIVEHPGRELATFAVRGHVFMGGEVPPFGQNAAFEALRRGEPGDQVRDRLAELERSSPEAPAENATLDELQRQARARQSWHAMRAGLIAQLLTLEPDAPELSTLLPYRWKYADLLPDIDVQSEVRDFAKLRPEEHETIAAGAYWVAAQAAVASDMTSTERESAADAFIASHPDDPRGARLLTLAWLAIDDPVAADRVQRRIAAQYRDTSEGKALHGQLRETEAVGETLDFTFLDHLSGREMSLKDLRGKVIALNFWATWCGPCVASMPYYKQHYARLEKKYGDRFEMIGVSLDADPQTMIEFCRKNEIHWPQLCEAGKTWDTSVARRMGINGVPRTIIVGSDGRVRNMQARALNFLYEDVDNVFKLEGNEPRKE